MRDAPYMLRDAGIISRLQAMGEKIRFYIIPLIQKITPKFQLMSLLQHIFNCKIMNL